MRILKLNNNIVDIDEQTAIGVTLQCYDIADPGKSKFNYTNNFSIPLTSRNKRLINFAGNPQSNNANVYDFLTCDYWVGNRQFIKNGRAFISKISDRVELTANAKTDIWSTFAETKFNNFIDDFITDILPTAISPANTLPELLTNENIVLSAYQGTITGETPINQYLTYLGVKGGHINFSIKRIFEYIETKYNVNFNVNTAIDNNAFADTLILSSFVPCPNIAVGVTSETKYYFYSDKTTAFTSLDVTEANADKTLADFVKLVFQLFNIICEQIGDGYECYRFDTLADAQVIELNNFVGKHTFKPIIDNYNQINYVKYAKLYEGANELHLSKKLSCKNKNIDDSRKDVITVNAYVPVPINFSGNVYLDLANAEAFNNFMILTNGSSVSVTIHVVIADMDYTSVQNIGIANAINLAGEYNMLNNIIEYPVTYEIKKYVNVVDVNNMRHYARYKLTGYPGFYYLNKISGYNPTKSDEPVTLQFYKI